MPQYVDYNGATLEFPDGMPASDIEAAIKKNALSLPPAPKESKSLLAQATGALQMLTPAGQISALTSKDGRENLLNGFAGAVRGAGSIGATVLAPYDMLQDSIHGDRGKNLSSLVTGKELPSRNEERRAKIDAGLQEMLGADPSSPFYQGGKLTTEMAGTMGVGGALAAPVRALSSGPVATAVATGLETGGFRVPGLSGIPALAARVGTGAATNGVSAGIVDPELAKPGAAIGALLPPAVRGAGLLGQFVGDKLSSGAERLMQAAIKPTLPQLKSGDAAIATRVLLDKGISPNQKGVERLGALIEAEDDKIANAVAGSNATIDKSKAANTLNETRQLFGSQVNPVQDLDAIQTAEQGFMNHPNYPGQTLSVQDAQTLKRGTYRVLDKKYGQVGAADTEAQKALARGLKDEIAAAVPDVALYNAELSRLLAAKEVAGRRALMEANKNPVGLAALASSPGGFAAFMADRSAGLKALAARGMNKASKARPLGLLDTPDLLPYVRAGLLSTETNP